jgi:hypothetical protein
MTNTNRIKSAADSQNIGNKQECRSLLRSVLLLITMTFTCFGPLKSAQAVTPAPDGAYANENTAEGDNALLSLTTGTHNTAIGYKALFINTTGSQNTAVGDHTLRYNTTSYQNTATGSRALFNNTGHQNTATGANTLYFNKTGTANTATGYFALGSNTTGNINTATGEGALLSNTTGYQNTATGSRALFNNATGHDNTAIGFQALHGSNGSNNIGLGYNAGLALTTGSDNIDIGDSGVAGDSNTIRIGTTGVQTAAYMQGISGATVASGVGVIVGSNGQLGTVLSSARFKDAIKPMDKASEAILALQPVTFRYKKELDPEGIPQFGLVAEQVEKVNPDLVVRDADGKVNTVRYEAVNAMLLNEFLKEHATVQELKKEIAALKAGLQKVSAQVELSKPAPQAIVTNK